MTSANVIDYRIFDKAGTQVGTHTYHILCKPKWQELLKFVPPEDYMIQGSGHDEEEAHWEDPPVSLRLFLIGKKVIERTPTDPPADIEVFDGRETCLVPYCCEGKVLQRSVFEAPAFRYAVLEPLLAEQGFICQKCRRPLIHRPKGNHGTR